MLTYFERFYSCVALSSNFYLILCSSHLLLRFLNTIFHRLFLMFASFSHVSYLYDSFGVRYHIRIQSSILVLGTLFISPFPVSMPFLLSFEWLMDKRFGLVDQNSILFFPCNSLLVARCPAFLYCVFRLVFVVLCLI